VRAGLARGHDHPGNRLTGTFYYLAPGLTQETILQRLQDFARRSPNWIAGDPQPGYKPLIDRLRRRGIIGPLWSYVSMAQRLWPAGNVSSNTL